MISLTLHEKKEHSTGGFPAEYYYVDSSHPRYQMPFHWHREWELISVRSGKVLFTVGEDSYSAAAGDLLLIPGGGLHGGSPSDNSVYVCLVFDLSLLCAGFREMKNSLVPFLKSEMQPFVYFKKAEHPGICIAAEAAISACADAGKCLDDCRRLLAVASIGQLFGLISRDGLSRGLSGADGRAYSRAEQLKSVLEYIEMNYNQPITLEALAELAGLNPRYFCQVFRDMTNRTPVDYLIFYRLEQASILLSASRESITAVSMQCGFNDSGYFSRRFRMQYGISPSEYRKRCET